MPRALTLLPLALVLTACGGTDSRYRDTQMLERPPTLPVTKQDEALDCCADEAVIPKKSNHPGLGDDVSLVATRPVTIKIKQPFETAWNNVALALGQLDFKITEQEPKQGFYYVAYQPASLLGSWLGVTQKEVIYQLSVRQQENEIWVTADLANSAEQGGDSTRFAADVEETRADAEDLLYRLYETLHDDLVTQ